MDWNRNQQLHITRHEDFSPYGKYVKHKTILITSSMLKTLGRVSKERSQ
jgi:hypothetical protein